MRRKSDLIDTLAQRLEGDPFWNSYFREYFRQGSAKKNIHVAIFREPFLQWVFDGTKTVESRFSQNEVAPYNSVETGDILLLKEVGGPLVGICRASDVWSYRLDPKTWGFIKDRFADMIGVVDEEFWQAREGARFATFVSLDRVYRLEPTPYAKSDRRGWVVARTRRTQLTLDL